MPTSVPTSEISASLRLLLRLPLSPSLSLSLVLSHFYFHLFALFSTVQFARPRNARVPDAFAIQPHQRLHYFMPLRVIWIEFDAFAAISRPLSFSTTIAWIDANLPIFSRRESTSAKRRINARDLVACVNLRVSCTLFLSGSLPDGDFKISKLSDSVFLVVSSIDRSIE